MVLLRYSATKMFFDRAAVGDRVGRASARVLSRFGAYVRTAARHSIRKRKAASRPGQPPSSHTGLLRNFIWFAYEPATHSVVIGPVRLNQLGFAAQGGPLGQSRIGPGTAPETLEYGGTVGVPLVEVDSITDAKLRRHYRIRAKMNKGRGGANRWQRIDFRFQRSRLAGAKLKMHGVAIAPRPYMGPALAAEQPRLESMWADAIGPT